MVDKQIFDLSTETALTGTWRLVFQKALGGDFFAITATNLLAKLIGNLDADSNNIINIGGILINNNVPVQWKDSGGTSRAILNVDGSNNAIVGHNAVSWGADLDLRGGDEILFKVNGSSGAFTTALQIYSDANVEINNNLYTKNNKYVWWRDSGSTLRQIIGVNSSNNIFLGAIGAGWGGDTKIKAGDKITYEVNGSSGAFTTAMTLLSSGTAEFERDIILDNNRYIYFRDSGATARVIVNLNASNNALIGHVIPGWGADAEVRAGDDILFNVNGSSGSFTTAMTLLSSGIAEFENNVYMQNNDYLYWRDSGGTARLVSGLDSGNNAFFGHLATGWGNDVRIKAGDEIFFDVNGSSGSFTTAATIGATGGLQMGSPTGGDKGLGTINTAADIYKNNSAYTNPDYALEHWATGKITKYADKPGAKEYQYYSIPQIEKHIKENHRLPGIDDEPKGMFERGDILLEWVERLQIQNIEQQKKIDELEKRLEKLEAANG